MFLRPSTQLPGKPAVFVGAICDRQSEYAPGSDMNNEKFMSCRRDAHRASALLALRGTGDNPQLPCDFSEVAFGASSFRKEPFGIAGERAVRPSLRTPRRGGFYIRPPQLTSTQRKNRACEGRADIDSAPTSKTIDLRGNARLSNGAG